MPNDTDRTTPETTTGEDRLPPAGGTTAVARAGTGTGSRRVPGPSETGEKRPARRGARGGPGRGNGRPDEPAELRREIERTRARMSGTLDAIEARIVHERVSLERKKDELVDRATLKPLRERLGREPWRSMAVAFVAGYVIASIRD